MPNEEKPLLVLKAKFNIGPDQIKHILKIFKGMREENGIIIIPHFLEPVLVPSDVEIKIESEDKDGN